MSFQRVPHEILVQVLKNLDPNDLFHFARVSHAMYAIAEQIMYHSITIVTNTRAHATVSRLLKTFLAPGDVLATRVRRLAWPTSFVDYSDGTPSPELGVGDFALFKAAASVFGINNSLRSSSAQFLLLLHLLPGLQVLHVTQPDNNGILEDFVDGLSALQPVATLPLALQSLRYFYWCTYVHRVRGVVPEFLMTIMRLPHIETIVVHLIGDYPKATADACVSSSRLEHLRIMMAPITPALMIGMLKIPVALKSFSYIPMLPTKMDLRTLVVALHPHQQSLEYLHLEIRLVDGGADDGRNRIESLRHWPALVRIRCSLGMLLGKGLLREPRPLLVNVLPACLEELEVSLDRYWSVSEVAHEVIVMLGEKQNMLPGLRRLVFLLCITKSPELLARVRRACIAAGVELIEEDSYVVTDCFTNFGNGGESEWP